MLFRSHRRPTSIGDDLISQCLSLQSVQAVEKEGLPSILENALSLVEENATALYELERVKKAKSALELELREEKRGFRIMHGLVCRLDSELESAKKALKEVEDERQMLQIEATQLERKKSKSAKKSKEAVVDGCHRQHRIKKLVSVVDYDIDRKSVV